MFTPNGSPRRLFWLLCAALFWLPKAGAAEKAEATPPAIVGRLVDTSGQPVARARVWLHTEMVFSQQKETKPQTTDAEGKFALPVPTEWIDGIPAYRQELGIIAYEERRGIAAFALFRESMLPVREIELAFPAESAKASVKILDHDGGPIAGAKVTVSQLAVDAVSASVAASRVKQIAKSWGAAPRMTKFGAIVNTMPIFVPQAIQDLLIAATDGEGNATIGGISPLQVMGVSVEAEGYGRQTFHRSVFAEDWRTQPLTQFKLRKLVPLSGQLNGSPDQVAGKTLELMAWGNHEPQSMVATIVRAKPKTDGEGRFSAMMPEGGILVTLDWDEHSPLRPVPPEQFKLRAGESNELLIKLEPATRAFGFVKDVGSGKGVAGVRVRLFDWVSRRQRSVTTDAEGRYEFATSPGMVMIGAVDADEYLLAPPSREFKQQAISSARPELAPVLVQKAATIRGRVFDESDQPVAAANIVATWFGYDSRLLRQEIIEWTIATDEQGRFAVHGVDPASECRLFASKDAAVMRGLKIVKGDVPALELKISPKNAVRLRGRIVDGSGRGVAGAALQIWRRGWVPEWNEAEPELVQFSGAKLTTDDAGLFISPPLAADSSYRVGLADLRYEPAHAAWRDLSSGEEPPAVELLARMLGDHVGLVHDKQGQPIGEALIQFRAAGRRIEAKTDNAGGFRLNPAPDGPGYLFVSKDGYRFYGQEVAVLGKPLDVQLAKLNEPYGQSLTPSPLPRSPEERRQIAGTLATELLAAATDDNTRYQALLTLAKVQPVAALEALEKTRFAEPMMSDGVRYEAAKAILPTSPDDALQLVQSLNFGHMTVLVSLKVVSALPDHERQRKLDLLAESLVKAQAIKEPGFRLIAIAMIADALIDLGEKERGMKLLTDQAETARKLNRSGYDAYLRGAFGEKLARADLKAASALVEEIDDYDEKTRHLGNMAHEIAMDQPEEAEKALNRMPPAPKGKVPGGMRDHYVERVCYRMARIDLPRATGLADTTVDLFQRAHAYGCIAAAIGAKNAHEAAALLRRAFETLEAASKRPLDEPRYSASNVGSVGGWLVMHAQQIDPELAAEARWRLLNLLPEEPSPDPNRLWRDREALASAALFLAIVDPLTARQLLTRLDGDLQLQTVGSRTWLPAWGLVDPDEAVKRMAAVRHEGTKARYQGVLAEAIAATGEARLRMIHDNTGLWRIDVEDFDF